jgi:deoxyribonuclease V
LVARRTGFPASCRRRGYLRELPPLRAVLHGLGPASLLVADGYAGLDPDGRPGLGAHAHAEFGIPVISVAKTAFHTATVESSGHACVTVRAVAVASEAVGMPG